jgi:hypothetical protein
MTHTTPDARHARSGLGAAMLAIVLTSVVSACGNLTAGGFGEAKVVANGDAPDTIVETADALASPARTDHEEDHGDEDIDPDGEIELEFRLYLESNNGASLELSDQELEVELELDGSIEADVITARVPANSYSGLRIAFSEIEIYVQSGVIIDGQEVIGPVDIEFEDLEVRLPLNLTVLDGSVVEILLDLNAATWLAFVDPDTKTVLPEDFAEAVTVRLR